MRAASRTDTLAERMQRAEAKVRELERRVLELEIDHSELRQWAAHASFGSTRAWVARQFPVDAADRFRRRLNELADAIRRIEQAVFPPPSERPEPQSERRSTLDPRVRAVINEDGIKDERRATDLWLPRTRRTPTTRPRRTRGVRLCDTIRDFAAAQYFNPARAAGACQVTITVAEIHARMNLHQRYAAVIAALQYGEFHREQGVRLVRITGGQHGQKSLIFEVQPTWAPPL